MDRLNFNRLINLFSSLSVAGHLIDDELPTKLYQRLLEEVQNKIELFGRSQPCDPVKNALNEIESNLYKYPESREKLITRLLRDFLNIAPYFMLQAKEEYFIEDNGTKGVNIGAHKYFNHYVIVHETLMKFDSPEKFDPCVPEIYIFNCRYAYIGFFNRLDALCLDFGIDIGAIQNTIGLTIWNRDKCFLSSNGYHLKTGEQTIKISSTSLSQRRVAAFYFCLMYKAGRVDINKWSQTSMEVWIDEKLNVGKNLISAQRVVKTLCGNTLKTGGKNNEKERTLFLYNDKSRSYSFIESNFQSMTKDYPEEYNEALILVNKIM